MAGAGRAGEYQPNNRFFRRTESTLQLSRLSPLLPALIVTACSSPPSPPPPLPVQPSKAAQSGRGVDLATDAGAVLNELSGSRLDFVARYYREPQSRWPPLSLGEAQLMSSLGLKIVAIWESHSRKAAHFSYSSGFSDAMMAYQQAKAIGQPPGSAIYFAVDFDAQGWSFERVDEYFRGIQAGLTAASGGLSDYAVGVYGSGAVCDAVKRAGLARYSWLSNSIGWTGSIAYEDWNIRQGGRWPELSFDHDGDEARNEYGGFQIANSVFATSSSQPKSGEFAHRALQDEGLTWSPVPVRDNQTAPSSGGAAAAALPAM
jgi:hypothetical protein